MPKQNDVKTPTSARKGKTKNREKFPPPDHLSGKMQDLWRWVVSRQELRPHQFALLQKCAEAFDRSEHARRTLKAKGLVFNDRFGLPKPRPENQIEQVSRDQFSRLLKQLTESTGLDFDPED